MAAKRPSLKTGHWSLIKEQVDDGRSRKALSRKLKDRYERACKAVKKYPLTCIMDQFENTTFDLAGKKVGHEHMKLAAISLLSHQDPCCSLSDLTNVAEALSEQHGSWHDETVRMRSLIWVHAGRKCTMLVFTWCGPSVSKTKKNNKKCEYVNEIDLRDNSLGNEGIFYVADLLPNNMYITRVNLAENNVGIPGLKAIIQVVMDNILIVRLDLSGNEITDEGAKCLAELIESRTGLIQLRANHNSISELGGVVIGHALAQNESLELLDLSWNHIRGKGAISIAQSLKTNSSLLSLNVAWNGFGKEGAKALGEALPENNTLTELDVTNNRINANGMAMFMVGLRTNETLQILKLGMNPISSDVAKHLLLIIEANEKCAITHIEMSDVSVDEDFAAVLERLSGNRLFNISHGKVVRKVPEKPYVPPALPPRDPLELMFEFKYEHGYRTLDLLMRMDKDNNMVVDREEFKNGLLEMDIEADDDQIDELMSRLDTNSDGSIDYSEFVQGEKEYGSRQKRHMNFQTLTKIRSLAAAMLKLRMQSKIQDAETRRLSTISTNVEPKLTSQK